MRKPTKLEKRVAKYLGYPAKLIYASYCGNVIYASVSWSPHNWIIPKWKLYKYATNNTITPLQR